MTELNEIYKCNICGNIVEMVHSGAGELVCCGEPMKLQKELSEDVGMEKHVPVIEVSEDKIKVKVGSVAHPMEESHFIEWIEIISDEKVFRKFLKPGEVPEAEFCAGGDKITSRIYCNIHGLWKSE